MPSPNHRPPFPGPRGSKDWCRVEKHLWPEQRAEEANTVPGGGEGKVSRPFHCAGKIPALFGAGLLSWEGSELSARERGRSSFPDE